jgi:hypothetical protein
MWTTSKGKRSRDSVRLAKQVFDIAIDETETARARRYKKGISNRGTTEKSAILTVDAA